MKRLLAIIIFVFAGLLAFSQSVLWKISGKKMKSPSYLYGTIHIQDKRVFNFDHTVTDAFNSTGSFAMEILMDEVPPEEIKNSMFMKDNSLDKLLSAGEYSFVDSVFKAKTGTGLVLYNKMKPFFLSSLISQLDMPKDMDMALDLYFLNMAREQGKPCYQVEEFSHQIKAIDAMGEKDQAEMLYSSLSDTSKNDNKEYDKLLEAYLSFDLEKMLELTREESDDFSEKFEKIFIIDRNKVMTKSLKKIMKKQSCFCAVGAAHLPGDEGVIQLLRKAGYDVEPVLFNWKD